MSMDRVGWTVSIQILQKPYYRQMLWAVLFLTVPSSIYGNVEIRRQMDTAELPEAILAGTMDIKTLKKSVKKTGTVIDLTGCSLDSVLYEVSAQRPVIAKTGSDTSVVIVGYDEYNTWLYDPVKKETYPYGMNDSTALFQQAGNVFISYLDNQK